MTSLLRGLTPTTAAQKSNILICKWTVC